MHWHAFEPRAFQSFNCSKSSGLVAHKPEPSSQITENLILCAPKSSLESKLFTAQTFRAKVMYTFYQTTHQMTLIDC